MIIRSTCHAEGWGKWVRKVLDMRVKGYKRSGRLQKRWVNCKREAMARKGVNSEIKQDKRE